jgi:hypothetical protein
MTSSKPAQAEPAPPAKRTEAIAKAGKPTEAADGSVIAVLNKAAADGTEISVSSIARAAAVDRTFLYRHRDRQDPRPGSRPPAGSNQRSREPHCKPTCSPRKNARSGSAPPAAGTPLVRGAPYPHIAL